MNEDAFIDQFDQRSSTTAPLAYFGANSSLPPDRQPLPFQPATFAPGSLSRMTQSAVPGSRNSDRLRRSLRYSNPNPVDAIHIRIFQSNTRNPLSVMARSASSSGLTISVYCCNSSNAELTAPPPDSAARRFPQLSECRL